MTTHSSNTFINRCIAFTGNLSKENGSKKRKVHLRLPLFLCRVRSIFLRIGFMVSSVLLWGCGAATNNMGSQTTIAAKTTNAPASVEGAWQLVWAAYNDTLADMTNHFLFKMFSNGVFSLCAYDSTKKIKFVGYGSYGFEGATYHETFMYHNKPTLIGGSDWQNLEVKGDTMYLNGFTKIVVGGKDVTAGWTKVREKLIKVKWQHLSD